MKKSFKTSGPGIGIQSHFDGKQIHSGIVISLGGVSVFTQNTIDSRYLEIQGTL